ncbi:glutathione S-transferase [Martelella mediterranea]|uniref:glutathione S-transferase n=1 Tax=Martelella mediterranea TaxID=293089 RepID=UPI001E46E7D6|nr:glutathione S-transferase [Martelella mediterranea]MCD1634850.1 glutathione S-transferase [Martelella mediterranea]
MLVHYLEDSRAHRILWLLEELGVDYEIKRYKRGENMSAPRELKQIHPLGKSPIIEDDGRVIAESGAIVEYLIDRYGDGKGLRPEPGTDEALRYRYWLHYSEGSAMPLLVMKLVFQKIPEQGPRLMKPLMNRISKAVTTKLTDPQLKTHGAFWDEELQRDGWFAGANFTAADIMMSFPVEVGMDRIPFGERPQAVLDYLVKIHARPAYRHALQRGGAYRYGGNPIS